MNIVNMKTPFYIFSYFMLSSTSAYSTKNNFALGLCQKCGFDKINQYN